MLRSRPRRPAPSSDRRCTACVLARDPRRPAECDRDRRRPRWRIAAIPLKRSSMPRSSGRWPMSARRWCGWEPRIQDAVAAQACAQYRPWLGRRDRNGKAMSKAMSAGRHCGGRSFAVQPIVADRSVCGKLPPSGSVNRLTTNPSWLSDRCRFVPLEQTET
jgi:hypothetical protein